VTVTNFELRLRVEDLHARYVHALDSGELERWPEFFTAEGRYRITTAENESRGLPLPVLYAEGQAMLRDRIASLRHANIYEPQRYRHMLSALLIEQEDAHTLRSIATSCVFASWKTARPCSTQRPLCGPHHSAGAALRRTGRNLRQPALRHAARHPAVASAGCLLATRGVTWRSRRKGEIRMMKKCPNCTNLMPGDVTRCLRCGFDSPSKMTALVDPAPAPLAKGRWRNGWALARESFRVLRADKQLLLFPLLSGIASVLVLASFIGALWAGGLAEEKEPMNDLTAWAVLFVYYFANYFVIVFCNAALVACAMKRFRGGSPTFAHGLRKARRRLGKIVAWASSQRPSASSCASSPSASASSARSSSRCSAPPGQSLPTSSCRWS